MKWLNRVGVLLVCTLSLTGCEVDLFVSQTPDLKSFASHSFEEIYQEANQAMEERRYNTAIRNFKALIALYSKNKEKLEDVYISLIYCYAENHQFPSALRAISNFKIKYPNKSETTLKLKAVVLEMQQKALEEQRAAQARYNHYYYRTYYRPYYRF